MKRLLVYVVYHDQGDQLTEALNSIDIDSAEVDCVVINTSLDLNAKTYLKKTVPSHIPIKNVAGNLIHVIQTVYDLYIDKYEFITRLDADDRFLPSGLKILLDEISIREDCAAAYGDWEVINEVGETRGAVVAPGPETYQGFHGACTIFRTKHLKNFDIKGYGISCQDGFCTYLYMQTNNLLISKIDSTIFQYRRHENNLSNHLDGLWVARKTLLTKFIKTIGKTKCILIDCSLDDLGPQDQLFIRKNCVIAVCGGGRYWGDEGSEPVSIPSNVALADFFTQIEHGTGYKVLSVNVKKIGLAYFDGLIEIFVRSGLLQQYAHVRYATVFSRRIWLNTLHRNQCINFINGATVPSFLECAGLSFFDNTKNEKDIGIVTDFFLTNYIERPAV